MKLGFYVFPSSLSSCLGLWWKYFHTLPSIFNLSSSNLSCFRSLRVLAWFHPGSPSSFLWDNAVSKLLPVWWVQMTPRTILGKLTSELAPDGIFDLRVVSCYLWPFWHPLIFGFGGGSLSLPLLTVCQWIFVWTSVTMRAYQEVWYTILCSRASVRLWLCLYAWFFSLSRKEKYREHLCLFPWFIRSWSANVFFQPCSASCGLP